MVHIWQVLSVQITNEAIGGFIWVVYAIQSIVAKLQGWYYY